MKALTMTDKRIYRERCQMMARIFGGYLHTYEIFDGDKLIGTKSVRGARKTGTETTTYTLGELKFSTAKEFIAAYEATIERAA